MPGSPLGTDGRPNLRFFEELSSSGTGTGDTWFELHMAVRLKTVPNKIDDIKSALYSSKDDGALRSALNMTVANGVFASEQLKVKFATFMSNIYLPS